MAIPSGQKKNEEEEVADDKKLHFSGAHSDGYDQENTRLILLSGSLRKAS